MVLLIHVWRHPEDNKLPDAPKASHSSGGLPIRLDNLSVTHVSVGQTCLCTFMEIWNKLPPVLSAIYSPIKGQFRVLGDRWQP